MSAAPARRRALPEGAGPRTSTGAYLLGLMPPELVAKLGIDIPLAKRDPHYFLPTTDRRYLLFGSDRAAMKRQFLAFFSERDWKANEALTTRSPPPRGRRAPPGSRSRSPLRGPPSATCARRCAQAFVDLCRRPVGDYLARFDFRSDSCARCTP